ncbi:endonuclease [archaeon]|nr:endonuclease [archaeon]|tara:strand:+ start:210 stop:575 length:366 start_codon:yes stop_codon:yes gene_type:complete
MLEYLVIGLWIAISLLFILYSRLARKYERVKEDYNQLASSKQSLSTKYGQMTEQFLPFTKEYPYDKNNFRFLGSPIDGVQFNEDDIVFIEFKSNKSQMTKKQKNIRDLIKQKKIKFQEFRI